MKATAYLTVGDPGSGKSYCRCASFLTQIWLREKSGLHYSNFPVKFDEMQSYVGSSVVVADWVKVIPAEEMAKWRNPDSPAGPWSYFGEEHGRPLAGAHVAIDEAHHYLPKGDRALLDKRKKWREWVSMLRHMGASVEFLTQNPDALDPEVIKICGGRFRLESTEDDRDPFLNVKMYEWYNLRAAFTGRYTPVTWEFEELARINGKSRGWQIQGARRIRLTPDLYKVYDSYSKPVTGKGAHGEQIATRVHPYQRHTRLGSVIRFLVINAPSYMTRVLLVAFFCWGIFCGGFNCLLMKGLHGPMMEVMNEQIAGSVSAANKSVTSENAEPTGTSQVEEIALDPVTWSVAADATVCSIADMQLTAAELYTRYCEYTLLEEQYEKMRGLSRNDVKLMSISKDVCCCEIEGEQFYLKQGDKLLDAYIFKLFPDRGMLLLSDGRYLRM